MTVIQRDEAQADAPIQVVEGPVPPGASLSCAMDEVAVFARDGRVLGVLGPGRYALSPAAAPFLSMALAPDGTLVASVYLVKAGIVRGLRFGGPIGSIEDAASQLRVSPRVLGEASVKIADPMRLVAAVVSAPGQDPSTTLASYVQYAVLQATQAGLGSAPPAGGVGPLLLDPSARGAYSASVAEAARARLAPMGIEIAELSSWQLTLSEEDEARLRAALGVSGAAGAASEVAYEMLWDCKFCGAKKLLGLTHRHCPSCGAPQNAEERYFPSDSERVLAKDHEYAGADVVCGSCGEANGRKAKHCGGCGAPLDGGKEVTRRAEQVHAEGAPFAGQSRDDARRERAAAGAPAAAPPPKRSSLLRVIAGVGCATVLVVVALIVVGMTWKKEGVLTVTGHSWRREISVEAYGPVPDSSWCDSVPYAARGVRRSREVRSQKRVPDGEDCHMHKVDRGNGTFVEKQECSPRYKEEPVYDEKCYYTVDRWRPTRKVDTSGASVSDAPRWPDAHLARTGTCEGCEREGTRTETYTVTFKDTKSQPQTCDVDAAKWATLGDGSTWKGEIRVLGGALDCATLKPD